MSTIAAADDRRPPPLDVDLDAGEDIAEPVPYMPGTKNLPICLDDDEDELSVARDEDDDELSVARDQDVEDEDGEKAYCIRCVTRGDEEGEWALPHTAHVMNTGVVVPVTDEELALLERENARHHDRVNMARRANDEGFTFYGCTLCESFWPHQEHDSPTLDADNNRVTMRDYVRMVMKWRYGARDMCYVFLDDTSCINCERRIPHTAHENADCTKVEQATPTEFVQMVLWWSVDFYSDPTSVCTACMKCPAKFHVRHTGTGNVHTRDEFMQLLGVQFDRIPTYPWTLHYESSKITCDFDKSTYYIAQNAEHARWLSTATNLHVLEDAIYSVGCTKCEEHVIHRYHDYFGYYCSRSVPEEQYANMTRVWGEHADDRAEDDGSFSPARELAEDEDEDEDDEPDHFAPTEEHPDVEDTEEEEEQPAPVTMPKRKPVEPVQPRAKRVRRAPKRYGFEDDE